MSVGPIPATTEPVRGETPWNTTSTAATRRAAPRPRLNSRNHEWAKYQEIRSGKHAESDPLYGSYNFLLEVGGVTPNAHTDWFVA